MSANRMITLHSVHARYATTESWKFDSEEFKDSEALHTVLTIRDPGEHFSVMFTSPNEFPEGVVRLQ